MEDANRANGSEVHQILRENQAALRADLRDLGTHLDAKIDALRPCIVLKQSCNDRHESLDTRCDDRHAIIDKTLRERMVDKNYFLGGLGVLGVVVLIVGLFIKFWA